MKNIDIEMLYDGLQELRQLYDIQVPVRVGYAVERNIRIIAPAVSRIIETRYNFIISNGSPDPQPGEPNRYFIKEENRDFVQKELESLSETDTPVNIVKLKIEDFKDLNLPLSTISKIMPMIISSEED